jgi:riboflavin kinase/FMN adenylyltransferase
VSDFKVLRSMEEWEALYGAAQRRSVVSIGNFDGLHLGHQKILRTVVERAAASGALAAAVTFDPHPLKILRPGQAPRLLHTFEQKVAGFMELGLDAMLVLHFNWSLAALSPEEFVRKTLVGPLRAEAVLVGHSFRFGHNQAGDAAALKRLGAQFGFQVEVVGPVTVDGEVVSSSAVRAAVGEGHVARAARLLGRPFALTGAIRAGAGRGSAIVVPTLNLVPEQELLPKTGVYATETLVGGRLYRSATNVGMRPTFDGQSLSVECHLFEFSGTVTEGRLEVRFWERLRDEMKFPDATKLREQIAADLEQARDFFRKLDAATPASPSADASNSDQKMS